MYYAHFFLAEFMHLTLALEARPCFGGYLSVPPWSLELGIVSFVVLLIQRSMSCWIFQFKLVLVVSLIRVYAYYNIGGGLGFSFERRVFIV